jgi:dCMP deaminase
MAASEVLVAYIPVLHEGYVRFLESHGRRRPLFLIGPELYADYRPLAKDIRCLDAELVATAIAAWGICSNVAVLDEQGAARLAEESPRITLPDEDVSHQVVERFFARCEVRYDSVFLRWDKSRSVRLLAPGGGELEGARGVTTGAPNATGAEGEHAPADEAIADIVAAAQAQAQTSVDWWRRVGAAIRFADGTVAAAANEHNPHRLSAYAAGDPRGNFFKGVGYELSTATHAEARLIAQAARDGLATAGAVMYVTDFPCPPCAKLIAGAGVAKLYFREGYAVLDGRDVLEAAGVEIVQVG